MTNYDPLETAAAPPLARATTRNTTDFDSFVMRYARAQGGSVALIFGGAGLAIGGGMWLEPGALMVAFAAAGLALVGMGGSAFAFRAAAHADWRNYFGTTTDRTYAEPAAAAPTVRPFVPSSNGAPTVRAGRFSLPRATWAALFETAEANGGKLTRDGATKALPRHLYRDWQSTLGELQRLQLVDADGRPTAAAWALAEGTPPAPLTTNGPRAHIARTHGARTGRTGRRGRWQYER